MAVTRLLRIKETPGSNPAAHLKKNLFYICRPDKTADGLYIGGNAGVSPEIIYDTMKQNKRLWGEEVIQRVTARRASTTCFPFHRTAGYPKRRPARSHRNFAPRF